MKRIAWWHKGYTISIFWFSILYMLYTLCIINTSFWQQLYQQCESLQFCLGAFVLLLCIGTLACLILFNKYSVKPLAILFLLLNSAACYFIKTYHIAIDEEMLLNVLQTNWQESKDLINISLALHVVLFGVVPAFFIAKANFYDHHYLRNRLIFLVICLCCAAALIAPHSREVFSFVRNHKPLRYVLLPSNYISATISAIKHNYRNHHELIKVGTDAVFAKYWSNDKPLVLIVIVGETARAQNFSLNGYERDTNAPLDAYGDDIINYANAHACGTSTAISVPCMFSFSNRNDFDKGSSTYTENVLDVMQRAGYKVIWIENNSDCKDVCNRVETHYPCPQNPTICNDEIMQPDIENILQNNQQNAVIVMHQTGSHGPKYYKRYSKEFAKFQPACEKDEISSCQQQEIVNAYDNTILYTSQMIAEVLHTAKQYEDKYNTVVFYISDHGESLGEYGIYLHSAPYAVAPETQTHIPFFWWSTPQTLHELNLDKQCLQNAASVPISHDNLAHTLLGIGGISVAEYNQTLDLVAHCKKM